jgi:soluble lytic murein transglycosylase-like protein
LPERSIRSRVLIGALFALPVPTAPIPSAPGPLTAIVRQTEHALDTAIDRWDTSTPPPRDVTLLALYEQRVVRRVASDPRLAQSLGKELPAISSEARATAELTRLTASGSLPRKRPQLGPAPPASRLLGWYREAQQRFGIRWQLLAAINFVESAFGKVRNRSGAGARGPMQFEPATWRAYGLGGNVNDPHDAILGAANYLAANHGVHDERTALAQYNHSALYVDAVLRYATRIARDRHAFFDFYSWQVYFRTGAGYRRVTGPR